MGPNFLDFVLDFEIITREGGVKSACVCEIRSSHTPGGEVFRREIRVSVTRAFVMKFMIFMTIMKFMKTTGVQ